MKIRVVTTASLGKAVQVVQYEKSQRKIIKHIGSSHSEEALKDLIIIAEEWIKDYTGQQSIFADEQANLVVGLSFPCCVAFANVAAISRHQHYRYFLVARRRQ